MSSAPLRLGNTHDMGADALHEIASAFGLKITPTMQGLINLPDAADPIAAQFIPSIEETLIHAEEVSDPISDQDHSPVEGIVHRHSDRVLLKLLNICAVHCRFCFRREEVGVPEKSLSDAALEGALKYIAQHKEIWEVILTGGDPLVLSDRRLRGVMNRLNSIPHVKVIRIHTRLPVVNPARITPHMIKSLKGRAPVYIFLHCNHPRELSQEAKDSCARLVDAGIPLLSQSVLLRGVNDTIETMTALMRAFVETRIKPHYLHHGDLARGTAHFRTTISAGRKLMRQMGSLSSLCQTDYVIDIPGGYGKVSLKASYAAKTSNGWSIEDNHGRQHSYRDATTELKHDEQ